MAVGRNYAIGQYLLVMGENASKVIRLRQIDGGGASRQL
jgi:hypothetical protein